MIQPRWYQSDAIQSIYSYFGNGGQGNPVLAMPTGTGKSHVIGWFIESVFRQWPDQRIMMLTHVQELIQQNLNKLLEAWPLAPVGVYSASLGKKQAGFPITYGGVGTVARSLDKFFHIDLLIVDECHLISLEENTQYQKIISHLRSINPYLKVIGLSATPFRIGQGLITDPDKDGNRVFTDICYDITGIEAFNRLVSEGYIAQLIPRPTTTKINLTNVGTSKGDYNQKDLQKATDKEEITRAALAEASVKAADRSCFLVFASGVEHAEHIADMMNMMGLPATAVHSKLHKEDRNDRIAAFKSGRINAMVGNNIFTTGFDHPPIDCIIMLRPTMSPGLWVQMLGRGTRPSPGKDNCLVLDFAGNTRRLGPINDPVLPRQKSKGGGAAPIKTCPHCTTMNHLSVRFCVGCGTEFEFAVKIEQTAGIEELMKMELPVIETYDVTHVTYEKYAKLDKIPTMQVVYYCNGGLHRFKEWIGFEHPISSFPAKKSRDWWRMRHWTEPPTMIDNALKYMAELRVPKQIRVHVNKKYPEIKGYEF